MEVGILVDGCLGGYTISLKSLKPSGKSGYINDDCKSRVLAYTSIFLPIFIVCLAKILFTVSNNSII